MSEWKQGTPRELVADLRPGGWLQGHSGLFPQYLRLHKTDLIAAIQALPADRRCTWKISGDPAATGRHSRDRRTVIIWLGK